MHSPVIDAWTAYWREGRTASCFDGAGLEVKLTHLWNDYVDRLPDAARVLDLATGNGIVARSCAARAHTRRITLQLEAVDAAEIDPVANVTDKPQFLSSVRFHGGIRLEALPYADRSFDGVVSQFGFEYADEQEAAFETSRVLGPAGRLRLVMHAKDGAVSHDIAMRLQRLRSVLAENGAVTLVRDLARAADAGDAKTIRSKSQQLDAASEQLRQLAERLLPDDSALFYATEFLQLWARRDRFWPADLRRSVEQGWQNASGVAVRQEQMLLAVRSADDVARISARFAAAGLIVDPAIAIRDEHRGVQIAWLLDACKPPAFNAP
jgi:ubiquinone/menaquinone biosynthesis C-methylase UbiE